MPIEIFALVPAMAFSLSALFTRRGMDASNSKTANLVVVLTLLAAFTFSLVAVDFSRLEFSWHWFTFMAAGVASPGLSHLFMYRGIHFIGVAGSSSVSNVHAFFGAFWAFTLLGERPPPGVWAGIFLVVAGVLMISRTDSIKGKAVYLIYPLLTAACFGLAHNLRKIGFSGGMESVLFAGFLQTVAAAVSVPIILRIAFPDQPYQFPARSVRFFVMSGVWSLIAQLTLLFVIRGGRVSLISPIVATTPFFTLLLTPVILGDREKITWRIVAGSILLVVGVVFVTTL